MQATFPRFKDRVPALLRSAVLRVRHRKLLNQSGVNLFSWIRLGWFILLTTLGVRPRSLLSNSEIPTKRIAICEKCPIFHPKYRTCGNLVDTWPNPKTGKVELMGCLCPMDVAVWVKFKDCWVYEQMNGDDSFGGWPKELNGSELNYGRRIIGAIARRFKTT